MQPPNINFSPRNFACTGTVFYRKRTNLTRFPCSFLNFQIKDHPNRQALSSYSLHTVLHEKRMIEVHLDLLVQNIWQLLVHNVESLSLICYWYLTPDTCIGNSQHQIQLVRKHEYLIYPIAVMKK